jgi:hypothetical protein
MSTQTHAKFGYFPTTILMHVAMLLITISTVHAGDMPAKRISSHSSPEDIDKLEQMRARQMRECTARQDTTHTHVSQHTIQASEDPDHGPDVSVQDGHAADYYYTQRSDTVLADSATGQNVEKRSTNVRQAVAARSYPDRVCCCPPNWCPLDNCPPEVSCALCV